MTEQTAIITRRSARPENYTCRHHSQIADYPSATKKKSPGNIYRFVKTEHFTDVVTCLFKDKSKR